jgi:hypothetical protein
MFSCKQDNSKEIAAFRSSLGTMNKETRRLLDVFEIKENGNSIAKPYRAMAQGLSDLITGFIDTTFNGNYKDTAGIRLSLAQLKKDYLHILDSSMRSYNHKMFLAEDSVALWDLDLDPVFASGSDPYLDHYLTTQKMLLAHQEVIRLLMGTISAGGLYFIDVTKLGYMINVCEDEKNSRIKCYYRYSGRNEKMEMLSYSTITDANGKEVKILSKSKMENDTLYMTTEKLLKGNYTARISYNRIRSEGERNVVTIEFPFSTW